MSLTAHKRITEQLAAHPFFAGCSAEEIDRLGAATTRVRYPADRLVLREGEDAEALYLVEKGDVALEVHGAHGGAIRLETLHAGDVLGYSVLVPPHRWTLDARTQSSVRLLRIDGGRLREMMLDDPPLALRIYPRLYGIVADRLHHSRLRIMDLYGRPNDG